MESFSELSSSDRCRLGAEALARSEKGTAHTVIDPDSGSEAFAIVTGDSSVCISTGRRGYITKKRFEYDSDTCLPDTVTDNPFRWNIASTSASRSMQQSLLRVVRNEANTSSKRESIVSSVSTTRLGDVEEKAKKYYSELVPSTEGGITVTALELYTPACPLQCRGRTERGDPVYIRHRSGNLSVRVGGRTGVRGEVVYESFCEDRVDQVATVEDVVSACECEEVEFDIEPQNDTPLSGASQPSNLSRPRFTNEPGRHGDFIDTAKQLKRKATIFSDTFAGYELIRQYSCEHPHIDVDDWIPPRESLQQYREAVEIVEDNVETVVTMIGENRDYEGAYRTLKQLESQIEQFPDNVTSRPAEPTKTSWEDVVQSKITHNEYMRMFKTDIGMLKRWAKREQKNMN